MGCYRLFSDDKYQIVGRDVNVSMINNLSNKSFRNSPMYLFNVPNIKRYTVEICLKCARPWETWSTNTQCNQSINKSWNLKQQRNQTEPFSKRQTKVYSLSFWQNTQSMCHPSHLQEVICIWEMQLNCPCKWISKNIWFAIQKDVSLLPV